MLSAEKIVVALCMTSKNWDEVYSKIKNKQKLNSQEVENIYSSIIERYKVITICSPDYPEFFKKLEKPPFCIFINKETKELSCGNRIVI